MMNKTVQIKNTSIDGVMFLGLIIITPMTAVLLISFIFFAIFKSGNDWTELFQTWAVMGSSFVLLPILILNKRYKITWEDIGVKRLKIAEILAGIFFLTLLYCYLTDKTDSYSLLLLSLQTLAVAFCEEIWARGILFFVIRKLTTNRIAIILLSSIIFAFFIHINRGFYNNLVYRLPGAILMGVVYDRSKKIHYSIMVHFAYNMLTSI